jgi:hypothetical protein
MFRSWRAKSLEKGKPTAWLEHLTAMSYGLDDALVVPLAAIKAAQGSLPHLCGGVVT